MRTNVVALTSNTIHTRASVAAAIQEARAGGRALAADLEARARELAMEARMIAALGEAVPVGIAETARQMAEQVEGHANRIRCILS
jgi:hypothetical protein